MNYGLLKTGTTFLEVKEHCGEAYDFLFEMVGGFIEFIQLSWVCDFKIPAELKDVVIVLNQEGKLKNKALPINLYSIFDTLHGNMVFAKQEYSEIYEANTTVGLSNNQIELLSQVVPKLVETSKKIKCQIQ